MTGKGEAKHKASVTPRPVATGSSAAYAAAMDVPTGHRKTVPHLHRAGDLHEFTFSGHRRLPLLTNDGWRRQLARSIDHANQEAQMPLVAFVFMPEHVHLLTYP